MTTVLPKITPVSTPVSSNHSFSAHTLRTPQRSQSVPCATPTMYGPYPPRELSSSMDLVHIPGRVNPLAPPPPKRRINMSWETLDQHHHNDKRRILMQRREHERYHSAWSKAFYGSVAEQEYYRKHFRDVLKQQMADHESQKKTHFQEKAKESEKALRQDYMDRENDREAYIKKHVYLQTFRDSNKMTMEEKWTNNKSNKYLEDRTDRERGRYNPINWTCSLK